jgi:hypothetical protein
MPCLVRKGQGRKLQSTKIELNHNQISRVQGLDEFARLLFPNNKNHQKVFLAVFIELKYASDEFLPSLAFLCEKYGVGRRVLETVRSKMRRMGLIDHVSRFNKRYGYREGWVFSTRFRKACSRLSEFPMAFRQRIEPKQERKDRDLFRYL